MGVLKGWYRSSTPGLFVQRRRGSHSPISGFRQRVKAHIHHTYTIYIYIHTPYIYIYTPYIYIYTYNIYIYIYTYFFPALSCVTNALGGRLGRRSRILRHSLSQQILEMQCQLMPVVEQDRSMGSFKQEAVRKRGRRGAPASFSDCF